MHDINICRADLTANPARYAAIEVSGHSQRRKRGVLVVRMDGIGDMVMFRAALEHYPDAFGVEKSNITILGCNSWKPLADVVFPGFKVVTIDEHAFEKKWFYRLKIALWVRRQGFKVAVCDMFMRKTLTVRIPGRLPEGFRSAHLQAIRKLK